MSETKHTPGEWTYQYDADGDFAIFGGNRLMAVTAADTPEDEANAKLFVAAPDMLDALKKCDTAFVAWQVGQIPGRPEDILALITEVRAAIAKAGTQ